MICDEHKRMEKIGKNVKKNNWRFQSTFAKCTVGRGSGSRNTENTGKYRSSGSRNTENLNPEIFNTIEYRKYWIPNFQYYWIPKNIQYRTSIFRIITENTVPLLRKKNKYFFINLLRFFLSLVSIFGIFRYFPVFSGIFQYLLVLKNFGIQ